ncbi:MAG: iron-containing alcohol dehydrogenase [Deltaproteobacteria bacterium]|nr:iron-containing alcohol dehydrogenase [Deltaproteobacteria bacterium]
MLSTRVFRTPAIIHAGPGVAEQAGAEAKRTGVSRALLITDSFLLSSGTVNPVLNSLKNAGVAVTVYSGVNSEPTLAHVEECATLLKESGAELLIGCGGGSPIDVAKAVSVLSANAGKIQDYMGLDKAPNRGLPIMVVPTTAGTGSEATAVTIITDTERDIKMLIISPWIMPQVALLDPRLTLKMPRNITAATGLDALTHAIEAYVSRKAQPMTDVLALSAVRLIAKNLPVAFDEPSNLEARAATLLGAFQAGAAFSNASVALVHGMSRPIGALFHVPHGVSNAVLLGPVMEFSLSGNYARYAEVAQALGVAPASDQKKTAEAGAKSVQELIQRLEIPGLAQLGVTREKLEPVVQKMANDAIASGSPANNPRLATPEEIISLYYAAL